MTLFRAGTAEGQAGLDAILADPAHALIASDFDGTLSPIVADPATALAAPGASTAPVSYTHLTLPTILLV